MRIYPSDRKVHAVDSRFLSHRGVRHQLSRISGSYSVDESTFIPNYRAEIAFGITQSKETSARGYVGKLRKTFIENDEEWEELNEQIVSERRRAVREQFPAIDDLTTDRCG